jgi:hypothetical protein
VGSRRTGRKAIFICFSNTEAHVVALIDVRPRSRPLIESLCASHGCRVVCAPASTLASAEPKIPATQLFIVEADRGGLA